MNKDILRSVGLLVLRLTVGILMAYHGYQKVFGGNMDQMIEFVGKLGFPLPLFFGWAAALSELLGGILVAVGLKTRFSALFISITMAVAFFMAHKADAFQVKELALVFLGASIALILTGAGRFSLDRS